MKIPKTPWCPPGLPAGRPRFCLLFTIYLPIFSICPPASFISVPAPLIALHPKSETIIIKTIKLNKVNFFIFVHKDNARAIPISAGCLLLCVYLYVPYDQTRQAH